MKFLLVLAPLFLLIAASGASAGDWITEPSYFTHDPQTGMRVRQYSPIGPFYTYPRGDFRRSGFRHTRSSIQVGTSADHYHLTEQWGKPIQPYGEWRHPFRPYSVPYDAWGPQFPGRGFGRGFGPYGHPGSVLPRGPIGGGGVGHPNRNSGHHHDLEPAFNGRQQLLDGRYPPFDELDPFERLQVFDHLYPPRNPTPAPAPAGN